MSHEIANLLLEQADSFLERSEGVKTALPLGMPLHEVEAYLDWPDIVRGSFPRDDSAAESRDPAPDSSQGAIRGGVKPFRRRIDREWSHLRRID